jgi:hypothetical protein
MWQVSGSSTVHVYMHLSLVQQWHCGCRLCKLCLCVYICCCSISVCAHTCCWLASLSSCACASYQSDVLGNSFPALATRFIELS